GELALGLRQQIGATEHRVARRHLAGRIEDAHDGKGGHRLARARFADQRHGLALVDREADMIEHLDHPGACAELDRQVLDGERGDRGHVRFLGSMMSRRPSPSRLKQNTASISVAPGNSATHHSPDWMKLAPSATMMPHSASGGRTPSPMKESPAAFRMA